MNIFGAAKSKKEATESLSLLLDQGAKINLTDKKGKTALMYAASNYLDTLKLLIEYGADLDAQDKDGETALI